MNTKNLMISLTDKFTYLCVKKEISRMLTSLGVVMIFVTLSYAPVMPILLTAALETGTIAGIVFFAKHSLDEDDKERVWNESYL